MSGPARKDRSETKAKVLTALLKGYTKAQAAKEAGIGRRTLYDIIDQDKAFAAEVAYAVETYKEDLLEVAEKELWDRALCRGRYAEGDPEKKGHVMLIVGLKRLDPEYKENYKTERKVIHERAVEVDISGADWDKALETLNAAREHQKEG